MFDAALASAVHRAEDHHGHIRQIEIVTDLFEGHYEAVTTVDEAFRWRIARSRCCRSR
jgi:hypothetical protein